MGQKSYLTQKTSFKASQLGLAKKPWLLENGNVLASSEETLFSLSKVQIVKIKPCTILSTVLDGKKMNKANCVSLLRLTGHCSLTKLYILNVARQYTTFTLWTEFFMNFSSCLINLFEKSFFTWSIKLKYFMYWENDYGRP